MAEWYERFFDGLYARVLPKQYDEAATLAQARLVKRLLRLRKGQCALDVPCGVGRLTIPLAQMGVVMTGVDITAPYLRKARRLARQAGVEVRWVHGDMRELDFVEAFHGAFNWFGSFGYFPDEDNLRFCRRVATALRPGGRFLVEGPNKSWLLAHFRTRSQRRIGGVHLTTNSRWDARTSRVYSTWTFTRGRTRERHTLSMRVFNGAEMRALLRQAGFRDIELFTHPYGRFTRHSRRLIAIGRKPASRR